MTDATDPIDAAADTDDADDTDADDTDTQREFRKDAHDPMRRYLKSISKGCGGADFQSLLLLLFIGLKLTGHIDWSWFWVLSPFWIRALFRLTVIALIFTGTKKTGWKPSGET